jgi:hypothetical protein
MPWTTTARHATDVSELPAEMTVEEKVQVLVPCMRGGVDDDLATLLILPEPDHMRNERDVYVFASSERPVVEVKRPKRLDLRPVLGLLEAWRRIIRGE